MINIHLAMYRANQYQLGVMSAHTHIHTHTHTHDMCVIDSVIRISQSSISQSNRRDD